VVLLSASFIDFSMIPKPSNRGHYGGI